MPNPVAYFMLAIWPLTMVYLFRRMPLERAIIWSILGAYLILPPLAKFDLPLVPDMDKRNIPNLALLVGLVFILRKPVAFLPQHLLARVFAIGFVAVAIPTALTNQDPVVFRVLGSTDPIVFFQSELPGMTLRDLLSVIVEQVLILIPFFVARSCLSHPDGLRELLLALVVGGLVYALPALFEVRFSPQLNIWIYGYFQHDFQQMIRGSGFRPIVFLQHGLWAAFLFMTSAISAVALARSSLGTTRVKFFAAAVFLIGVVYLSKSLGSYLYTLAFVPLLFFAPPRVQTRVALVLVLVSAIYPVLRQTGLVPTEWLVEQAASIDEFRAHSLAFRFANEEQLLVRAQERPLFGWGSWGRNLTHHEETGEITSILDGEWIGILGSFGWFGYVFSMGLLALPVILLSGLMRRWSNAPEARIVAALSLLLGITMLDLLLNAILTPFTWLITGALLGYAEKVLRAGRPDHGDPARRSKAGNTPLPTTRTKA